MSANQSTTVNIGEALRGGLRITAGEAVALVHEACAQLDAGTLTTLPTSVDELSLRSGGLAILPSPREHQALHLSVAAVLDELLGMLIDSAPAPPALRSLPARLRTVRNEKSTTIRDLMAILRWHLSRDPKDVLHELFVRTTLAGVEDDDMLLPHTPAEAPASTIAPAPAVRPTPAPAVRATPARAWFFAAAALVAFFVSGYAGYRYLSLPDHEVAAPVHRDEMARPRIEPRSTPESMPDEPRPLTLPVRGGAFSPSFTAQSRTLLFHAGRNTVGHLYSATLDDRGIPSKVTPLLDEPARNYHARLSPDGNWIAFDSDRDGERGVYIADRAGTRISRVNGDGFGAVPSWSPDMKSLAFIRAEPGRPRVWNLWIRTLATGAMTRVTNYRYGQAWGASWFPDSASYAYSHEQELVVADRSGRRLATYQSPVSGRIVRTPAVSPDGRRIVFQVFGDGIWVLDLDSGTMHGVLDDQSAEEFAWDPSGRRIAYHSRRDGEWRIWVLTL